MRRSIPEGEGPIIAPENVEIVRKPKAVVASDEAVIATNGESNGTAAIRTTSNGVMGKRKRDADEAGLEEDVEQQRTTKKRGKLEGSGVKDDVILLDDEGAPSAATGAIMIDDD